MPNLKPRSGCEFPKSVRILRSTDFRRVYDQGFRHACPFFAAFCLREEGGGGPRVGFTVPRALGKAVVRNRLRRRVREAVRTRLVELQGCWAIVFNPRPPALEAPLEALEREVERLFRKCSAS